MWPFSVCLILALPVLAVYALWLCMVKAVNSACASRCMTRACFSCFFHAVLTLFGFPLVSSLTFVRSSCLLSLLLSIRYLPLCPIMIAFLFLSVFLSLTIYWWCDCCFKTPLIALLWRCPCLFHCPYWYLLSTTTTSTTNSTSSTPPTPSTTPAPLCQSTSMVPELGPESATPRHWAKPAGLALQWRAEPAGTGARIRAVPSSSSHGYCSCHSNVAAGVGILLSWLKLDCTAPCGVDSLTPCWGESKTQGVILRQRKESFSSSSDLTLMVPHCPLLMWWRIDFGLRIDAVRHDSPRGLFLGRNIQTRPRRTVAERYFQPQRVGFSIYYFFFFYGYFLVDFTIARLPLWKHVDAWTHHCNRNCYPSFDCVGKKCERL